VAGFPALRLRRSGGSMIADEFVVPEEALELVPRPLRHAAGVTQEPSLLEEMLR